MLKADTPPELETYLLRVRSPPWCTVPSSPRLLPACWSERADRSPAGKRPGLLRQVDIAPPAPRAGHWWWQGRRRDGRADRGSLIRAARGPGEDLRDGLRCDHSSLRLAPIHPETMERPVHLSGLVALDVADRLALDMPPFPIIPTGQVSPDPAPALAQADWNGPRWCRNTTGRRDNRRGWRRARYEARHYFRN
jgi:hypothetical protein